MSLTDKITGRVKKAAGDLADDPSLRREGRQEERKGEEKDELAHAQSRVEDKASEVSALERKPCPPATAPSPRRAPPRSPRAPRRAAGRRPTAGRRARPPSAAG